MHYLGQGHGKEGSMPPVVLKPAWAAHLYWVPWSVERMTDQISSLKEQVPLRHELRSLDSESRALTITPQELVHRGMK